MGRCGGGYSGGITYHDAVANDVPIIEGTWTETARLETSIRSGKYMIGVSVTFTLAGATGSDLMMRWFINGAESTTYFVPVDNDIEAEGWHYQFPMDLPEGDLEIYGEVNSQGGGVVDGVASVNNIWIGKVG